MTNVRAQAGLAAGTGAANNPGIEITHFLWLDWARIAQRQLPLVRAARTDALQVLAEGGNWAVHLESEHTNSLVTISACAHALDGVYGQLRPLVTMPQLSDKAGRHDHIRAALGAAFKVRNDDTSRWKREFTWLHDLRDAAVHPMAKSRPSVPHPIHGNSSYESARYCLESSERAMALLMDVLGFMASPERTVSSRVREYGAQMAVPLRELLAFI